MRLTLHAAVSALTLAVSTIVFAPHAAAQDTGAPGVRLGLSYALGTRPGVLVLPADATGPDSIRTILQRDLDYDDRASVIALDLPQARAFVPTKDGDYNYAVLEKLGVVVLIHPRPSLAGVTVSLYDVPAKKLMRTATFSLPADPMSPEWRMALHGVSDELGAWIFGQRGAAQTRILYGYQSNIWSIDSDGANARRVTTAQGGEILMSPAWHPSGTKFAYVGLQGRGSQIGIHNLETGESYWNSASVRGLNLTPAFSPDGRTIAFANGRESGTDVVVTEFPNATPARRLTVGRGSDNTSPCFSPDGRRIAFMSGRAGHPEIYSMDADGTNVQLLTEYTYGEGNYRASPSWAPDGRMLAYQSRIRGQFQVMTMDLRDRSTKQYTSEGENEDPDWAPDSRHLVFSSTRSGVRQLWVLDVESGRLRQLTRQSGARLPAWSPRLKP